MAFSWSLFLPFAFQILTFSLEMDEELQKRNTDCVYFLASPLTCKKVREKQCGCFVCFYEIFLAYMSFLMRLIVLLCCKFFFFFLSYDSYSMVCWIGPTFERLICYVRVCWNEGWLRVLDSTWIELLIIFMFLYFEIIWHLDLFYVVFDILTIF
jgi:hypothetical protein